MSLTATLSIHEVLRNWDCVVIGGGPAGSMAGRQAARAGLSTLIVERRSFPRTKVCGACVNQRALSVLNAVGLSQLVTACGGRPIHRFSVRAGGHCLNVPLPGGMAVSRSVFDQALVRAAIASGAHFLPETSARVVQAGSNPHTDSQWPCAVTLSGVAETAAKDATSESHSAMPVRCKVVIAADGLGHPSLTQLPQFAERRGRGSRIGAGTSMACDTSELPAGTIHMAVGTSGYAGLVRVEDGQLNIAAALNPQAVRHYGHPGLAVQGILLEAGLDFMDVTKCIWTGTPQLTRRTPCVADGGVFVVGDAAGYVEPFTGEGIAWALVGGVGVAECATQAVHGSGHAAAQLWQIKWRRQVLQRQSWCRRLAWLLKFSAAAPTVVRVAARFPGVASPIVKHLNTGFDDAC